MTGRRKSIAGQIFEGFLEGVVKALEENEEARKQAERDRLAEEERAREARQPKFGLSQIGLDLFGDQSPKTDSDEPNPIARAVAQLTEARQKAEADARKAKADDLHWHLLATDPEYRAASARRDKEAQRARDRLWAKQKADLRKMRELSSYGRDRQDYGREECSTCDGRGDYISKRNRIVGCIDCAGRGWRRVRY